MIRPIVSKIIIKIRIIHTILFYYILNFKIITILIGLHKKNMLYRGTNYRSVTPCASIGVTKNDASIGRLSKTYYTWNIILVDSIREFRV